ncbi:MAG: hypothetical protein GY847_19745 [Proteobacteria bacterium]|nr:hypothetical protein [Pseudomonadota bacterium]
MPSRQINNSDFLNTSDNVQNQTNVDEDQINLIDLFMIVWKRKWFIILCSIIPPLIVGLFLFLSPRNYEITYSYDARTNGWDLNKTNYDILLTRFFSSKNQEKIVDIFHENELDNLATSVKNSKDGLKNIVKFESLPLYLDISKTKKLSAEQIVQLRKINASILKFTITGNSENDIQKISSIIRTNFESLVPLYMIIESFKSSIKRYRSQMADIEKQRFDLQLQLKTERAILKKLKRVQAGTPEKSKSDIMLQFNIGNKNEYLPISNQVAAIESRLINLEQKFTNNEINYRYYNSLLSLNTKLLAEVEEKASSRYTIQQFHSYLSKILKNTKKEEIKDYLNSYIKDIENRISSSTPISLTPRVLPVSKGTVKTSAIIFALSIVIALFAAFLMEGLKKRNNIV